MLQRLLIAIIVLVSSAHASVYNAFQDGESFRYKVSWGIFANAGEIKVSARREIQHDQPVFRITMVTSTRGVVRGLYTYDDTAEALIDGESGRLITATEKVDNGEQSINATTTFDYGSRLALHRDAARPGRNVDIPIPDGDPIDLLSALIGARFWKASPGDKRAALIFAGRDVYPINIYADRIESISYKNKTLDALLLLPRMDSAAPRGIFKKGGEIRVWMARDEAQLPVKMQLKLKIGTAQLTLVEHTVISAPAKPESP